MWGSVRRAGRRGDRGLPSRYLAAGARGTVIRSEWRRVRAGMAVLLFLLSVFPTGGASAQPDAPPGRPPREAPPVPDRLVRQAVAVNRAAGRVYVADPSRRVLVVRAATPAAPRRPDGRTTRSARPDLATVPIGDGPYALTADPGRNRIYVANGGSGTVTVVDGATNHEVATVPVGRMPAAIAVDRATGRVFVANRDSNTISVIDSEGLRVFATLPVKDAPISLLMQAGRAYAAHRSTRDIAEIAPDGRSATIIPGGFSARAAAIQPAAAGTTFAVTSTADQTDAAPGDGQCRSASGACTLRAAIQEANARPGADTITLPAGTYALTLAGGNEDLSATGDLDIRDDLVINGAGATTTIVDAGKIDRVLHVVTPHIVEVLGVTIRGGNVPEEIDSNGNVVDIGKGSGIYHPAGTLTISQSVLTENRAETFSTAGGGIYTTGNLTLLNTRITNNHTWNDGGGIYNWAGSVTGADVAINGNEAGGWGGGILNDGSLTLDRAEMSGNHAWLSGGGLFNFGTATLRRVSIHGNVSEPGCDGTELGGGIFSQGELTVTDGTISENLATVGGGVAGSGTFTNVTISGNVARHCFFPTHGGGASGSSTFINATIVGNVAHGGYLEEPRGNYVWFEGDSGGLEGALSLQGTILADNATITQSGGTIASNCGDDASFSATSRGNNLDSDGTCGLAASGDLSDTPAGLGPLADNGGPTQTHALLVGSPALDNGPAGGCPATDQRGTARPQDGNGDGRAVCDIGAYEAPPTAPPSPPPGNLVRNPSFETDLGSWGSGESALRRVPGGKDGAWAMRVAQAGSARRITAGDNPDSVLNLQQGETFTATAWVRAAGATRKPVRLVLLERGGPSGPVETAGAVLTPTDAWQQVTVSHVVAQPGRTALELSIRQPTAAPDDAFLLDAVTLARGATPLLTVTKAGAGSGTVTSTPSGIDCGNDCTGQYPLGAQVQLMATAAAGSTFVNWSGACTGKAATCVVTMDADKKVTATFKVTADLILTSTDAPDPVGVGQVLTYTIQVTNNGPSPASVVKVVDTLTNLAYDSAAASQGSCATSATTPVKVTCTLGSLAVGGTATVTIRARPTAATPLLRNTAYATTTLTADPSPNDAKAVATTRVVDPAAKIAFTSRRDGNPEIYATRPDGSGQSRLTTNAASDQQPAWSADRSKLAFSSMRDGDFEVYTMDADGTNPVRVTTHLASDQQPTWSPDGKKLAFVSDRAGNFEVYVMNADGTNVVRLTTTSTDEMNPVWSPNGAKIAFTSRRDGNPEIYVMNADGTGQTRLTSHAADDVNADWSPDGSKLVFVSTRDGNPEIYVVNADGANPVRLTTNAARDTQPAWSPDGARIAFVSDRDGNEEVYVMNTEGTGLVRLTTNVAADGLPDW